MSQGYQEQNLTSDVRELNKEFINQNINGAFVVKMPNSQAYMPNRSVLQTSNVHRPEILLRKKVNSYVSPKVCDVIREHVMKKTHDHHRYTNQELIEIKSAAMKIPEAVNKNNVEEYRQYPVSPGVYKYRPESQIPTTFGTAIRFT